MFALVACANDEYVIEMAVVRPQIMPFSDPDLVNPLRGQYENLLHELFPQSTPSQSGYPAWPGTRDVSARIPWRDLQPVDPRTLPPDAPDDQRFDFARLDAQIAAAAERGKRFGFRVTAFDSCCDRGYPNNVNMSAPGWLRAVPGATSDFVQGNITHVVPNWNSAAYLDHFEKLLAALGRRYDRDDRLALFEMSGYGDFSENHVAFMRDDLTRPGPAADRSMGELGYLSQYQDQYISRDSIIRLVTANLRAFPNTQIIASLGNPEIAKQLLRDSAELPNVRKPVGIRADGLGAYGPIPIWADNEYSEYVKAGDPIIGVIRERYRSAPIVTEWPPQMLRGGTVREYYERGLHDVVEAHVSMTASTGFPGQFATAPMDPVDFDLWSRANKYAGYRYATTGVELPRSIPRGTPVKLSVDWTNFGSAPTYDNWAVVYEVVDESGDVVERKDSTFALGKLTRAQQVDDPSDTPHSVSGRDIVEIAGPRAPGKYSVRVRVLWDEHKPDSPNRMEMGPMKLAQFGNDQDGGYQLGSFVVTGNSFFGIIGS